ncbi:MAG: HAD-IA family hydrolase [Planctomycetota bacterium]|nr:HAD-IA family hydrolase [Planctomycetota bacterium]
MALKAVFIDVGNTLLYEKPSRFEIYAERARASDRQLDANEMRELMTRAHRELPREIGGAFRYSDPWFHSYVERIFHDYLGLLKSEMGPLTEELFGRFSDPATFAVFDGGHTMLDDWRARGLKIGIISNWSARLPRLLAGVGIAERVDFVLCSAIERLEKPDATIFERALAQSGVRADEALHAGDDFEKDVLGAQRVGIRAVLVDHAGKSDAARAPRVQSLHELGEFVARLAPHGVNTR